MIDSKQNIVEGVNMWQTTKFRYITKGANWAWGRNQVENKVWGILFTTTLVSFSIGAVAGGWLGIKLWTLLNSYNLGYWPILWTVLLALFAGMALTIGLVQMAYRILWPLIEASRNVIDSRK